MKHYLLFILLFWTVAGRSQTAPKEYKFTSMTDFGLFEEAGMSGNVNVSLPLFDLQVPTYRYPVALEYNQEGNVNGDAEGGQFGEAWNLNLMGAVTRITRPTYPVKTDMTLQLAMNPYIVEPSCGTARGKLEQYDGIVFDELYYANGIPLNGSRPDTERDVFKFQVPGVSGKFYLDYSFSEGLNARLLEQSDYCSIKIVKASGSATIDAIEITDKKGYRYILDIKSNLNKNYKYKVITGPASGTFLDGMCNQYLQVQYNPTYGNFNNRANDRENRKENEDIYAAISYGTKFWQELNLSKIYDKDGRLLVNIQYEISRKRWTDPRFTFDMFGGLREMEKYIVNKIELANVGMAVFQNKQTVQAAKHLTEKITLTDVKGNVLKTMDFTYDESGANLNGKMFTKALLTSVKDYSNTSKPQVTTMNYKKYLMGGDNIYDADHYFGYTVKGRYYGMYMGKQHFAADMFALQKIKYPTGGVVLYRFGPNTSEVTATTARLYNMDNQTFTEITAQSTGTSGTYRFTLGTVDRIFILTQLTNGVKLYRVVNGVRQLVTTIYSKGKADPFSPIYRTVNKTDNVYEWPYVSQLAAGTYEVDGGTINPGFTVMQMRYVADASLKNFIYREGLRIEEVAYFNEDVNQGLLESPGVTSNPEKRILYDYGHSARQLFVMTISQKPLFEPPFYYLNVTTINEGIGKKTTVYASDDTGLVYKKPAKTMVYDQAGNLLEETVFNRETEGTHAALQDLRMMLTPFEKKTTQTTKSYDDNKSFTTTTVTDHNAAYYEPGAVTATDPLGKVSRAEYDYTFKGTAIVNTAGRSYINGTLKSQQLNTYDTAGNLIKTEFKTPEMAAYEKTGQENTKYIDGLLVGYTQADGTPVTLAYGYNGTQVIAKIVNLDANTFYSTTYQPLLTNLDAYSNPYNSSYNETSLKTALNGMRATFPNALVTSYTYKPMIGISSITDENLQTTTYEYDAYNRLRIIKDYLGNILKEYEYNLTN